MKKNFKKFASPIQNNTTQLAWFEAQNFTDIGSKHISAINTSSNVRVLLR